MNRFMLCIDDSGSREPDRELNGVLQRKDKMDWFALGGVLIKNDDIGQIVKCYNDFVDKWGIKYPLHSSEIRGRRKNFAWLNDKEKAKKFYPELGAFIVSLPIIAVACVIHRPGYVDRYKDRYGEGMWYMCKTAFCILVERVSKYVDQQGGILEIIYESAGKREDQDVIGYLRCLKKDGNPFNQKTSIDYLPFDASDYKRIIAGEPKRKKKDNILLQVADLALYPIAKGRYEPNYEPYLKLLEYSKIIDCVLSKDESKYMSVKYSCFDGL